MRHGRPDARRLKAIEGERESAPHGEVVQWAHDSVAALLQDVGVNHGGADVRVSQQGLDGANVRTPLQEMCGEAVAKRMRTDPLADSRLTDGVGNGLVDGAGVEMVAANLAGARVGGPMTGGEDVLPSPIVTTRASYRRRVRRERFEWPPEDCIPGSPWTGGSLRFGNRLRRTFGCGSTRRLSA